jgi:hypothetical protein
MGLFCSRSAGRLLADPHCETDLCHPTLEKRMHLVFSLPHPLATRIYVCDNGLLDGEDLFSIFLPELHTSLFLSEIRLSENNAAPR